MDHPSDDDEEERQDLRDGEDLGHLGRHFHIAAIDGCEQT